ncbi:hypothetical protein H2248_003007 [Termitomyces sp. 'cryptogamus']|nr:hypothetical protein H2248_003007 [Termitomyces sp. 'cryptogamus']
MQAEWLHIRPGQDFSIRHDYRSSRYQIKVHLTFLFVLNQITEHLGYTNSSLLSYDHSAHAHSHHHALELYPRSIFSLNITLNPSVFQYPSPASGFTLAHPLRGLYPISWSFIYRVSSLSDVREFKTPEERWNCVRPSIDPMPATTKGGEVQLSIFNARFSGPSISRRSSSTVMPGAIFRRRSGPRTDPFATGRKTGAKPMSSYE